MLGRCVTTPCQAIIATLTATFTLHPFSAPQAYLAEYQGLWRRVVGVRPTGWTHRRRGGVSVRREGPVTVLGVPYSEHSSWSECGARNSGQWAGQGRMGPSEGAALRTVAVETTVWGWRVCFTGRVIGTPIPDLQWMLVGIAAPVRNALWRRRPG